MNISYFYPSYARNNVYTSYVPTILSLVDVTNNNGIFTSFNIYKLLISSILNPDF